ncbi:MAG: exopolysaccharide biosynthesis polyprenyl glycosylphosphotransferase [Deltaproteobacteria bacterium]|nr:exopolysaccharide biosynthesis polyprenyl glycosylphosphotransferase [Deltaproteobacteria bacterium]
MKIQKKHLATGFKVFCDIALILLAFQCAYLAKVVTRSQTFHWGMVLFSFKLSLVYTLTFVLSAERLGQYSNKASLLNVQENAGLLRAVFIATIFFTALNTYLNVYYFSWDIINSSFFVLIFLACSRHYFFKYHHKKYLEGKHERKVVIYGAGETGQLLFKKLYFMEGGDYSLVGFLDDQIPAGTKLALQRSRSKALPFISSVLGGLEEMGRIVKEYDVSQVMIAMPSVPTARILEIIQACIRNNVAYGFVPHLYDLRLEQVDTRNIGDIPLLKKRDYHLSFLYSAGKRGFDLVISSVCLLLSLPLLPVLALLVKMGGKGPVFFKQKRAGKEGKLFTMYNFRTMAVGTPVYMPSPSSNMPSKYVNKIGSFLRDTNLDEIPQLWNVFKGEMSIVGPRPEMPFHVEKYNEVQRDRLKVQPGLTGLWQISPDRDKEIHDNIDYDLYYINHQSFFLDMVLVLETFILTCNAIGKKLRRFLFRTVPVATKNRGLSVADPAPEPLSDANPKRALPS